MDEKYLEELFRRVDQLSTGERVLFQRACGKSIREVDSKTLLLFYRVLPYNIAEQQETACFLAVCIHCLWRADEKHRVRMEQGIRRIAFGADDSDSMKKRATDLLDTAWDEDGYLASKLTRMAKILKSKDISVDGRELVNDICHWNHPDHFIQKKWARAYAAYGKKEQE